MEHELAALATTTPTPNQRNPFPPHPPQPASHTRWIGGLISSRRPRAAGSTAATDGSRCLRCFPLLLVVLGAQERLVLLRVILHLGRDVVPAAVGRARKQVGVWVGSQTTRIRSFRADFATPVPQTDLCARLLRRQFLKRTLASIDWVAASARLRRRSSPNIWKSWCASSCQASYAVKPARVQLRYQLTYNLRA